MSYKSISISYITAMAKYIKNYVEKNKKLPSNVKAKDLTFTLPQATYLMSRFVYKPVNDVPFNKGGGAKAPTGVRMNKELTKAEYQDMARRVYQYIDKNGYSPNNVWDNVRNRVSIILFTYCLAKIIVFYAHYKELPNTCLCNTADFEKGTTSADEVYNYFIKVFGKVNSIDEALAKIQGRGYDFYYDDMYSNRQTIDRLKNGFGVNCTDVHHMLYHIGKALGYKVRAVHVWCITSNVGHVRLDFNKGDGWFSRDGASVIDGGSITSIWCSNGTVLAYDPDWFFANINR